MDCNSSLTITPLEPARGEIRYTIHGKENKETVVLIHGLNGSSQSYEQVVGPLSKKYQVITYDQRGHGRSLAVGEDYSSQVMAADLKALLDHLNIAQADVVGHSMGGRTAIRFAEQYPDRVRKLIIEDMEVQRREEISPAILERVRAQARLAKTKVDQVRFETPEELFAMVDYLFKGDQESLDYYHDMFHSALGRDRAGYGLGFRVQVRLLYELMGNGEDLREVLREVKCPTLFMQADVTQYGVALTQKGVQIIRDILPQAEIIRIKNAEHSIHRTQLQEYLATLFAFLKK